MKLHLVHGALALALLAGGCELVADFDRSKIPADGRDSGLIPMPPLPDAGPSDASTEDDAGEDEEDAGGDEDAGS